MLQWIFYNQKGIRSGWRLLTWFSLSLVSLIVLSIGLAIAMPGLFRKVSDPSVRTWFLLSGDWILFVPVFIAAVVVALIMEQRPVSSLGFGFHSRWLWELLAGMGAGALMLSSVMFILICLGAYRVHGFQGAFLPTASSCLVMAAGFLGVGVFEEFLFRGYFLQNLIDGLGLPAAAAISCLLFGLTHAFNPGENPAGILNVFLAGILFLVLIVRTRSLWMAVGLHAAWDWSQNFLFGVADSGIVLPGGLLRTTAHGPAWLTGGTDGPEGSVIGIFIVGLAILFFARSRWVGPSPDAALLWAQYVSPRE